jgi:two-component system, OmpR family, sensor kinase
VRRLRPIPLNVSFSVVRLSPIRHVFDIGMTPALPTNPLSPLTRLVPSNMRLSNLLALVFAILLAGSVACAGLTFWVVVRTKAIDERIALAQESASKHEVLKSELFHLFKEMADALIIGDRDRSVTETGVRARIEATLQDIQNVIGREIEVDAEEELEELQLLRTIDHKIDHVVEHYEEFLLVSPAEDPVRMQEFVHLLDQDIDKDLASLIDVALAGEREEVAVAMRTAADFRHLVAQLATGILGFMLATLIIAVLTFRRAVLRPLLELMTGAEAYRQGRYDTPIPVSGAMEFGQLANTLTDMAGEISTRERDQREVARKLESRVGERTTELQTILTRFEQVEASRRQMMADVSHELRTPLTIIQGEADISLRSGQIDPEAASEAFARIRDAARHSNKIVEDLLLVAREEAGQLRLDLRSVDLDAALADAASLAQSKVEVQRFGRQALARVDPVRVRQCLLAVMNNARRYGGQDVRARVERGTDGFDIIIEDNGPGMSKAEKDHAFDRFFRGSGAQSSGVEGTGLGLPIVRSIMAAHGGTVDLSDREGGGLVVRLRFAAILRSIIVPNVENPARQAE